VLVNNAGASVFHPHGDLEGVNAEIFQKLYQVNTIGAFQMIRAVVPAMKNTGGRIVNVASVAGLFGVGSSLPYACSKAAMLALNKSMARELGPTNIYVNAVCPGMVEGDWLKEGLGGDRYELAEQHFRQQAATGDIMNADSVADNIWLFAAGSSNVTGEQLILDGGASLQY
jgi:3-oxoacyl-[acyl-carrier protein] reductase